MKISFDYYTKDTASLTEAYRIAVDATGGQKDTDVSVRYDPDDDVHNLMGTIDHTKIGELFTYFEENGFVDDRYNL